MMEPILKKAASLFVEKADLDPLVGWLSNYESRGITNIMLKLSRGLNGGDWVGGEIALYRDCLSFHPNSLNKMILKDAPSVTVKFSEITSVCHIPTIITGTVQICLGNRNLKIRCFDSKGLVEAIKLAMHDCSVK
jgi:hypothetical protein